MPPLNVVSFCLWGGAPKYLVGAVRNAQVAPHVYPGWEARFYVHDAVPAALCARLASYGARVLVVDQAPGWTGLFWRYWAIGDESVDVAIFRDCDSRLSVREAVAVEEWLRSGRTLHVMRDHPAHRHPIMGGLWGLRCAGARWIAADARHPTRGYWQADQEYLAAEVWPRLRDDRLEHDEFFAGLPFPLPRIGDEFAGQVFDEHDMPCERYIETLRRALGKTPFVVNRR